MRETSPQVSDPVLQNWWSNLASFSVPPDQQRASLRLTPSAPEPWLPSALHYLANASLQCLLLSLSNEITTRGLAPQQWSSFKNSPGEVGPENHRPPEQERFQLGRLGFLIGGRAQRAHNHRVVEEDGQPRHIFTFVNWRCGVKPTRSEPCTGSVVIRYLENSSARQLLILREEWVVSSQITLPKGLRLWRWHHTSYTLSPGGTQGLLLPVGFDTLSPESGWDSSLLSQEGGRVCNATEAANWWQYVDQTCKCHSPAVNGVTTATVQKNWALLISEIRGLETPIIIAPPQTVNSQTSMTFSRMKCKEPLHVGYSQKGKHSLRYF